MSLFNPGHGPAKDPIWKSGLGCTVNSQYSIISPFKRAFIWKNFLLLKSIDLDDRVKYRVKKHPYTMCLQSEVMALRLRDLTV